MQRRGHGDLRAEGARDGCSRRGRGEERMRRRIADQQEEAIQRTIWPSDRYMEDRAVGAEWSRRALYSRIPFRRLGSPECSCRSLCSSICVAHCVGQECHGHGQPKTQDHGHAHSGGDHGSVARSKHTGTDREAEGSHATRCSAHRFLCDCSLCVPSHSHAHAAPAPAAAAHGHSHGGAPCHGHGGAPVQSAAPAIASATDVCQSCKKGGAAVTLSRCSRCKAAWYCSRECQTADWKEHKKSCNA